MKQVSAALFATGVLLVLATVWGFLETFGVARHIPDLGGPCRSGPLGWGWAISSPTVRQGMTPARSRLRAQRCNTGSDCLPFGLSRGSGSEY